jgi:transposase InsO family protein
MELDMKASGQVCAKRYAEYRAAGKKEKGKILDEVVRDSGGNRDYWATKLRDYKRVVYAAKADGEQPVRYEAGDRKKGEKHPGGRPRVYGDRFVKTLTKIWADFGFRGGKRLVPDIRGMIEYLCKVKEYKITKKIKAQLLTISAAQADRLLEPARKIEDPYGLSLTKPGKLNLRSQVPVCTYHDRAKAKPGEFCTDTVAHSGWSGKGQFCKSLTYRDFYSGWLEERALPNGAESWVKKESADIKANLPFPLTAIHDDDGGEFINIDFISWCIDEHIKQTRSRPNHKNDNALAEQTNFDVVRKRVGYFRFDTPEEYNALVEVYKYLCPLYNYWFHSAKLVNKEQLANGKSRKIYEGEAKTPYDRLQESPDLDKRSKAELKWRKAKQNPVTLMRKLNAAVDRLLQINREKDRVKALKGRVKQPEKPPLAVVFG